MNKIAIFPGSFDPFHIGHLHVLKKALKLFDEVVLAVSINIKKTNASDMNIRVDLVSKKIKQLKLKNVTVQGWTGYTVDLAKKLKAKYLIRGIRNFADFQEELLNASVNKKLNPKIETVFFLSDQAYQSVSSTAIKKVIDNHKKYYQAKKTK
ncbi:pantetheine-phosphate adenylyltransferase [[Mycoplasma] testudinis]|uniref:pantetheine-phosphate adenylyltransferase n=1 Tax=[Mycoplasma] testudinis TaxID=33924 RepID=UPI00056682DF|nr:pantetheine-phosphate adenylyltransferase [[Mycoplasma] testudinis]